MMLERDLIEDDDDLSDDELYELECAAADEYNDDIWREYA